MEKNELHEKLVNAGIEVKNNCVRKSDVVLAEQILNTIDGWEHDSNSGSWVYDPEGILLEDGTASVPTVVLENGGYNYYCRGDDYPSGSVTTKEFIDLDMSEEEAEEAALAAAKEAALEGSENMDPDTQNIW
jgi:hypothetical protein